MADIEKIHTTDLPIVLNREFYNDLVENFTIVKNAFTEINMKLDKLSQQYDNLNKEELHTQLINETGTTTTEARGPITVDINDSDPHILQ